MFESEISRSGNDKHERWLVTGWSTNLQFMSTLLTKNLPSFHQMGADPTSTLPLSFCNSPSCVGKITFERHWLKGKSHMTTFTTVDGWNPANQLRLVVFPIIYRDSAPSQVVQDFSHQQYHLKKINLCVESFLVYVTYYRHEQESIELIELATIP